MVNGLLVSAVFLLSINFYVRLDLTLGSVIGGLFMFLTVLFSIVQNYVYTLMVYTDLRVGSMYKNAILLVLLSPGRTVGLVMLGLMNYMFFPVVLLGLYSYLTIGIFTFLYSFLAISLTQYLISCAAAGLIEKNVSAYELVSTSDPVSGFNKNDPDEEDREDLLDKIAEKILKISGDSDIELDEEDDEEDDDTGDPGK